MSKGSDAVKKWRRVTKNKIVLSLGGGCCICGYNKCNNALEIHHLDPEEKDFTIGSVMARPASWEKIAEELKKCVLLCSNHHKEVHEGMTEVALDAPRFDEWFINNDLKTDWDNCPVCSELKPPCKKTCSRTCAARLSGKIRWDDEKMLSMYIENESFSKIADYFGCSILAVHKRYEKITRNRKRECPYCNSEFIFNNANQKYCSPECASANRRKCIHPTKEQLSSDIAEMSWCAIGRKYGVSDNACKKWARNYGLIC